MERGKTLWLACGEKVKVESRWAAHCQRRDTTVASSTWETTAGTLSDEALASPTATVVLEENGCGVLTNRVTLANGEKLVRQWRIEGVG